MKANIHIRLGLLLACSLLTTAPAIDRYVSLYGGHIPPFTSWADAATNIQAAIDASSTGDTVWVTNGVYAEGGKVKGGDLTNRVALDKPLTVRSVNGALMTVIQGAWDPATNGPLAVRCAWLTNGAVLSGFTLRGGATRAISVSATPEMFGGGVWGVSTNASVSDCRIEMNSASFSGGGAHKVTLTRCVVISNRAVGSGTPGTGIGTAGTAGGAYLCALNESLIISNRADQGYGGGVHASVVRNCALIGNSSHMNGGAAHASTLLNCSVTGNISSGYGTGHGAAVYDSTLANSVVWGNLHRTSNVNTNHANCTFSYSDTYPLPAGVGNISVDPQLLADSYHLSETSPCRGAGTNFVSGTDIDGQPWNNPPALGCDEWRAAPVVGAQPGFQIDPVSRSLNWRVVAAGQVPLFYFWLKDGVLIQDNAHYALSSTANPKVMQFGPEHAGKFQVIVSNTVSVITSQVAQVVVHCVDATSLNPSAPYSDWSSAATTIQEAIDVAAAGGIVLVTNGIYASGGRATVGDLTNRVTVNRALTVMSMNGPATTSIQGAWDPATTNGPLAVRCAWLTNAAVLRGFTLHGGATRASGVGDTTYGGGVAAAGNAALVSQCWILTNAAAAEGGGAYKVSLDRCRLLGNSANFGGGASQSAISNSLVRANLARLQGGGAYNSDLLNCTVVYNRGSGAGAGVYNSIGSVRNCIIVDNNWPNEQNYYGPFFPPAYSCIRPAVSGTGNISALPALLDDMHIAINSPCRGAGSPLYASGQDIDSETWSSPPSIGCDEPLEAGITGTLSALFTTSGYPAIVGKAYPVSAQLIGRASWLLWSYGDETFTTNNLAGFHTWTNAGDYTVTFTAFNADYPAGYSTNLIVQVVPLVLPTVTFGGWSNNAFTLSFLSQAGVSYRVQRTADLTPPAVWQTVTTLVNSPGGVLQVIDPAATDAIRFYRVRVL